MQYLHFKVLMIHLMVSSHLIFNGTLKMSYTLLYLMKLWIIFILQYCSSYHVNYNIYHNDKRKMVLLMSKNNLLEAISKDISASLRYECKSLIWKDDYESSGGGSGASVGIVVNIDTKQEYFVKKVNNLLDYHMLHSEYHGILEIYNTNTIRVPKPITFGTSDYESYVVFEKISLGGISNPKLMAEKLSLMHHCYSPNNMYGWKMNNTCGATIQINNYTPTWSEFWDKYRQGHILHLAKQDGAKFPKENELRQKVKNVLDQHKCKPSLVHGDLWSGNQGYTTNGDPIIFDPALYYGDREVDIAMSQLFGSNHPNFYKVYNENYPVSEGFLLRKTIYNLYHILNHYVLFGGGYLNQANSMIDTIIKS